MEDFLNPKNIWLQTSTLKEIALPGEPVEIPIQELKILFQIIWLADDGAQPAVFIKTPVQADINIQWDQVDAITHKINEGIIVGHEETGSKWGALRAIEDLSCLLMDLPSDTEMELLAAGELHLNRQRYKGMVRNKQFLITHTYPAMSREILLKALALSRQVEAGDFIQAETEQQANQVILDAEEELGLLKMKMEGKGCQIYARDEKGNPDPGLLAMVAYHLFQRMFKDGPWDFSEIEREEADCREAVDVLDQAVQKIAHFIFPKKSEFHDGAVVHQGKASRFGMSNITAMPHVVPEDIEILDEEMKALGFQPLGDMVCEKISNVVIRCYAAENSVIYGMAMAGADQKTFVVEFYSNFDDQASISTSTMPGVESRHRKKIYRYSHPWSDYKDLFARHNQTVADHNANPVTAQPTLKAYAETIDSFLVREGKL
ncbi:hypothetical protein ACFL27_17530 [candidate division CSSED10-310 bacterium]|uniref:Uncharacterized protein n=1 Tax=candidate division CSSED10-310 bacterium TaxID=2855610 RepID=A0ABV6Z0M7_UNCC1